MQQLDRIDRYAVPLGLEVQVGSGDAAGCAGKADPLLLAEAMAFMDVDAREMHVDGEEALPVVDDDAVAFVAGAGNLDCRTPQTAVSVSAAFFSLPETGPVTGAGESE